MREIEGHIGDPCIHVIFLWYLVISFLILMFLTILLFITATNFGIISPRVY
jgi:hypothetical protein